MDRITHQPPRQQGYGSTSSLRNDSLKNTQKHERRKESNQRAKQPGSGGPSGQERWIVRTGYANCTACCRGLSAPIPRTVRPRAADCLLNLTEPPVANPEKRTVRGEHADCPPGTRGLSAPLQRTVRNLFQPKLEIKTDQKRSRERTRRTHNEHSSRGLSATTSRIVRRSRTDPETTRPRRSTLPTHHRISQTVEAVETRVWGHDKHQTRMLYPKNFAS
jgi:hypothetical protein